MGDQQKAAIPECRRLPKKEYDLYKSIGRFYEIKQYKKGVKAADAVLKKFPKHGETQALKALVLNGLERKEEAYELVKQGLRNDVRSSTCWHVFGILHRHDRNYGEAAKCYLNAQRIDPNNLQLLRDLSQLQVQVRDLPAFAESRRQILCQKPGVRGHWIGYAVAAHLAGQHSLALSVIDEFLGTLDARDKGFEEGELVLYKALVLEQAGSPADALALLDAEKRLVVDGLGWRAQRARLLARLGRRAAAEGAYRSLVGEQPDNYRFHAGLQACVLGLAAEEAAAWAVDKAQGCTLPCTTLPLTDPQRHTLLQLYDALATAHPKSLACQRIPLSFLEGGAFAARVDAYMRKHLHRGLPSLGADLAALYRPVAFESPSSSSSSSSPSPPAQEERRAKDPYDVAHDAKYTAIAGLVQGYLAGLEASGGSSLSSTEANGRGTGGGGGEEELRLWTTYLHAQLLEARGLLAEALAAVEACVGMAERGGDVTARIDMLQRQARLLKKGGDVAAAAAAMEEARRLDLSDRYVNNKATKYLLRAGKVEEAQATIALFARHEGDPQHSLVEMQCIWYELEWARAMEAEAQTQAAATGSSDALLGLLGKALKKYTAVERHFADFAEDQFDFHGYCLARRPTLRAYVDVLRMEDELWGHPFYQRAAKGLVACYLQVHAIKEAQGQTEEGGEPDYASMTPEERKRAKAKARKAAKKAEEAKQQAQQAGQGGGEAQAGAVVVAGDKEKEKGGGGGKKDDDPDGEKLLAKDPLAECARIVTTLTRHAPQSLATHVLAYDVATRRGKVLLALQALVRGQALRPHAPEIVLRTVDFFAGVGANAGGYAAAVIAQEKAALLGGGEGLEGYVEGYAAKAVLWDSLPHTLAAARAQARIRPGVGKGEGVVALLERGGPVRGASVEGLKAALRVLEGELGADEGVVVRAKAACAKRFPMAAAFK